MGSKRKKGESGADKGSGGGGAAEEGKQMITDPRFSSAHTDPRFRRVPRRDSKVTIDSRFQGALTDKASAPVDKRGKRRRGGSVKDSLRDYYRIEDEKKKNKRKMDSSEEESGDDSEAEQALMDLKSEGKSQESSDAESEEEIKSEKKLGLNMDSSDGESDEEDDGVEVSEEEDTDEDDEAIYEDDGPEVAEENITNIEKETHRLAIVRMDWRHVSAKDLYVVLNSFVPKDGRILSVAVYPTEFGLERIKEEEIHGPAIDGDKNKEDDDDEEEEEDDEDVNNEKLRDYEKSRLKYYHAVAECDSIATADFLYKSCDGLEFEKSSNKLDLRFIPDSMEFKHPPRDIATEAPANYEGLDFQSRALQLSKVNLSWDEDEPHRMKTLNQKFNPDQLAELEMKEFLASDESESDDDNNEASKKEKRKEKYRALIESEDADSDKDEEEGEENDQDMEVTFNTGLEDLSKQILERKDKKSETVWESHLRQKREKKRARKNKQKDDSSSPDDDDDDYNVDGKAVKDDGDDDFFMEEPPLEKKKKKEGKTNKKKKGLEEEVATEERSRAELELLLVDENAGDGNGLKGYNIKRKGKKRSKEEIAKEKIPAVDLDDIKERFSAAISDPDFALDPTDPQFKRSAIYVRQLGQKQKEDPRSHEEAKATVTKAKEESTTDGKLGSKSYADSIAVKSLKLKIQHKDSDKKKAATADLALRMKNKAKALSNK